MDKEILYNIDLEPNQISTEWKSLKSWFLSLPLPDVFADKSRLKIFAENFSEYFREYDVLKDCTQEEYKAVLFYYAKTNEGNTQSPRGVELSMIIRILSKIRDSI